MRSIESIQVNSPETDNQSITTADAHPDRSSSTPAERFTPGLFRSAYRNGGMGTHESGGRKSAILPVTGRVRVFFRKKIKKKEISDRGEACLLFREDRIIGVVG